MSEEKTRRVGYIPPQCKLERAASKDQTRFALMQPHVVGGKIYSTNGRILVKVEGINLPDGPVPKDILRETRRGPAKRGRAKYGVDAGKGVVVYEDENDPWVKLPNNPNMSCLRSPADYTFPDCEQAIPDRIKGRTALRLNRKLLIDLLEAMGTKDVVMYVGDPNKQLVFKGKVKGSEYKDPEDAKLPDEHEVTGVIMPMRD